MKLHSVASGRKQLSGKRLMSEMAHSNLKSSQEEETKKCKTSHSSFSSENLTSLLTQKSWLNAKNATTNTKQKTKKKVKSAKTRKKRRRASLSTGAGFALLQQMRSKPLRLKTDVQKKPSKILSEKSNECNVQPKDIPKNIKAIKCIQKQSLGSLPIKAVKNKPKPIIAKSKPRNILQFSTPVSIGYSADTKVSFKKQRSVRNVTGKNSNKSNSKTNNNARNKAKSTPLQSSKTSTPLKTNSSIIDKDQSYDHSKPKVSPVSASSTKCEHTTQTPSLSNLAINCPKRCSQPRSLLTNMPTPVRHASSARKHILCGKKSEKGGNIEDAVYHYETALASILLGGNEACGLSDSAQKKIISKLKNLRKKLKTNEELTSNRIDNKERCKTKTNDMIKQTKTNDMIIQIKGSKSSDTDAECNNSVSLQLDQETSIQSQIESSPTFVKSSSICRMSGSVEVIKHDFTDDDTHLDINSTNEKEHDFTDDGTHSDIDSTYEKFVQTKEIDEKFVQIKEIMSPVDRRKSVTPHFEMSDPLFDCIDISTTDCKENNQSNELSTNIDADDSLNTTNDSIENIGVYSYEGVDCNENDSMKNQSSNTMMDPPPPPSFCRRWRKRVKTEARSDDEMFAADSCPMPISAEVLDFVTAGGEWRKGIKESIISSRDGFSSDSSDCSTRYGWSLITISAWERIIPILVHFHQKFQFIFFSLKISYLTNLKFLKYFFTILDGLVDAEGLTLLNAIEAEAASGISPVGGTNRDRLRFCSFDLSEIDMPTTRIPGSEDRMEKMISKINSIHSIAHDIEQQLPKESNMIMNYSSRGVSLFTIRVVLEHLTKVLDRLHCVDGNVKGTSNGRAARRTICQWARVSGLSKRRTEEQRKIQRQTKLRERTQVVAAEHIKNILNGLSDFFSNSTNTKGVLPFANRLADFVSSILRFHLRASLNSNTEGAKDAKNTNDVLSSNTSNTIEYQECIDVDRSYDSSSTDSKTDDEIQIVSPEPQIMLPNTGSLKHNLNDLSAVTHHALTTLHRTSQAYDEICTQNSVSQLEWRVNESASTWSTKTSAIRKTEKQNLKKNVLSFLSLIQIRFGACDFILQLFNDSQRFEDANEGRGTWQFVKYYATLAKQIKMNITSEVFSSILEPFCMLGDVGTYVFIMKFIFLIMKIVV